MFGEIKTILKRNKILVKYVRFFKNSKKGQSAIPKKDIRGQGNIVTIASSSILYDCIIDIDGNNNEIEIGDLCQISNVNFHISGNGNKIKIGRNVRFNKGGSLWVKDFACEVYIGEYSTFENVHIAVTEPKSKVKIGNDCMFAYDIDLRTGDSHSIIDLETNKRINYARDINIGNHVWIASHVSILKGVSIPSNSVVATRSVVTKSFSEENIIVGGVPARTIRQNINWDRRRIDESQNI